MLINNPPYFFWSAWRAFSMSERLFFLVLFVLIVYALFSGVLTALHVRRKGIGLERTLSALQKRSVRLQRLIGTSFYLFGIVLFFNLQWAYSTFGDSTTPGGFLVLENFETHFIFAFNVFIALLILYVLGWFIANQVGNSGLQ